MIPSCSRQQRHVRKSSITCSGRMGASKVWKINFGEMVGAYRVMFMEKAMEDCRMVQEDVIF